MKTAEQRAEEVADLMGVGKYDSDTHKRIARSFIEHARDQRHLCAESVAGLHMGQVETDPETAYYLAVHDAIAAVMNTPAPDLETTPVQENG